MTGPIPRDQLLFRRARLDDLPAVLDLLTEAARWARDRGVERWWEVPFPEGRVRPGLLRGEVVVVERDHAPVATLTLTREDPLMWGEEPPVAGYLHRLASRRSLAGRGLGAAMIDWADAEVGRWGRGQLRLDCLAANDGLVRYYLAQGFHEVRRVVGRVPGEDRPSVLMERPVRRASEAPPPTSEPVRRGEGEVTQWPRGLVDYRPSGPADATPDPEEDRTRNRIRFAARLLGILRARGDDVSAELRELAAAESALASGAISEARARVEELLGRLGPPPAEGGTKGVN